MLCPALILVVMCLAVAPAAAQVRSPWPLCTAPGDQTAPQHAPGHVFWVDARNPDGPDLYESIEEDSAAVPFVAAPGWQSDLAVAPADGAWCPLANPPAAVVRSMVVWVDTRSGELDLRVKSDGYGYAWSATDVPLCSAPGFQTDPRIVRSAAASSSWIVGWLDRRSVTDRNVYAQRIDDAGAGQWAAEGIPVCVVPGYCSDLQVVADGAGGAFLAWTHPGGGVRVQRITAAGIPAPGWPANGLPVSGATASTAMMPALAADGTGGVLVFWNDLRATGSPADADLYGQHIDGVGTLVPAWPSDGRPVCTAFQDQSVSAVVSDGAGGAIVVWMDGRFRSSEELSPNDDIRALRVRGDGGTAPGWSDDGTVICGRPFLQSAATAMADGEGGVYVAWEDRNGSLALPDIRASHRDASGQLSWTWPADGADGVVICDAPGAQTAPAIGFACGGHLLVAWVDERDAATRGTDIYAVTMSPNGRVAVPGPAAGRLALGAPTPNPARAASTVRLDLPAAAEVVSWIADVAGRRVAWLAAGEPWTAGAHTLRWDGRDGAGRMTPAGVYALHVRAGAWSAVRSVVRLR